MVKKTLIKKHPSRRATTERREDLTKHVGKLAEEGRIVVRNIRRDANNSLRKLEGSEASGGRKGKGRGGDKKRARVDDDPVQEMTDKYIDQISQLLQSKENELLEL